jgi:hypothetical protein
LAVGLFFNGGFQQYNLNPALKNEKRETPNEKRFLRLSPSYSFFGFSSGYSLQVRRKTLAQTFTGLSTPIRQPFYIFFIAKHSF